MKRALAERAKQSGLPNGVGPSVPPSVTPSNLSNPSPSSQAELSKSSLSAPPNEGAEPTFSSTPANTNSSNTIAKSIASTTAPKPSPRPKKRLRESIVKLEEEDEDDSNAAAFYLRHQNRSLASELRQLKFQLTRLERERDTRRSQCSLAVHNLNELQTTWTQLEEALQNGQPAPMSNGGNTDTTAAPERPSGSSSAPLSTGSGTSVELIGALFNSIAALGTTTSASGRRRIKSETGDTMDVDGDDDSISSDEERLQQLPSEPLPPVEGEDDDPTDPANAQQLEDLMRITDNVAQRASTLQGWIWSLLQRLEKDEDSNHSSTTVSIAQQVHAAQQQVARLKAKNKALKAQMNELARSRDESQESEKRVRRGLYRLAAGRVQLKEVLKAIVASDEDKVLASQWMGESSIAAAAATATTSLPTPSSVKTEDKSGDGKESSVSSFEVAQLQKKILDLEQVASARDEQIKTVRRIWNSATFHLIFLATCSLIVFFPVVIIVAGGTGGTNKEN
jgi:hypothetical protein